MTRPCDTDVAARSTPTGSLIAALYKALRSWTIGPRLMLVGGAGLVGSYLPDHHAFAHRLMHPSNAGLISGVMWLVAVMPWRAR